MTGMSTRRGMQWATVTPKQFGRILDRYFNGDPCVLRPLYVWGAPGIGKSAVVKQSAVRNFMPAIEARMPAVKDEKELKAGLGALLEAIREDQLDSFFKDIRLLLHDPTEIKGIPTIKGDVAVWLTPSWLPRRGRDNDRGVIFLDELASAPPLVQTSAHQLVLDRRLGEYKLPDGWHVIAASNPKEVRAISYTLPSPLANRFVHLNLKPDVDDWKEWAFGAGIRPEVIAFISFRGGELLFDMSAYEKGVYAFPTPRSWEAVSRICDLFDEVPPSNDEDYADFKALIEGAVGPGAANEFLSFLEVWHQLPDPMDVLEKGHDNPQGILNKGLENPSLLYAFITEVVHVATERIAKQAKRFKPYVSRVCNWSMAMSDKYGVPKEYCVLAVHDLVRSLLANGLATKRKLLGVSDFVRWSKAFRSVIVLID